MAERVSIVRSTLLAALALVLAQAPAASAAKGHGGVAGSSSLALVMVADANGNGLPNHGDTVTFSVATTATSTPEVGTACFQNGAQVYYHEGGFYPGDPWAPADQRFVLQSYVWTSGAADCTATLFYMNRKGREVDVATLAFHVGA